MIRRYTITTIYAILLLFMASSVFSQRTEERKVSSFSEIKVGEAIDLYIKAGSDEAVRIEIEEGDVEDVETKVSGGVLKIGMRPGNYRHSVKVYVTYRKISGITATSASSVYSDGPVRSERLQISISSAASGELEVDVEELSVQISSSGDLELEGKARNSAYRVSSAGDLDAYDLQAENVTVQASSAGDAKVFAGKTIKAHASSGADIRYRGNPASSNTDSSSGGSVRKSGGE